MADAAPIVPLDLSLVERDLAVERTAAAEAPAWLRASQREPRAFWESLVAWVDGTSAVRTKIALNDRYDPYHDLVIRHLGSESAALAWRDAARGPQSMGFRELAERATRRAVAWRQAGATPGQVVCALRPMGRELLVSIVAALKAGLVIQPLPPLGTRFVTTRLAAAPPHLVDTDDAHRPLLLGCEALVVTADAPGDVSLELDASITWATGATAAMILDPTSPTPAVPAPLSIDALMLCALRDGVLALGLRRGDVVTAPGLSSLDLVPALPLAALLCGATLLHLTLDDLRREPALLASQPLRAVGLSAAARELLLEHPARVGDGWHTWFRDPSESLDVERWQQLVDALDLHDAGAVNLLWRSAMGGCTLFSGRRKGRAHADVLPSAGVPFVIADFLAGGAPAPTGHGRLALNLPGTLKPAPTPSVIVPHRRGWAFGGSFVDGHRGRRFLKEETHEALAGLNGCLGASVCLCPVPGSEHLVDLLLFTGVVPKRQDAALIDDALRLLAAALGEEHLPDRVRCFPLPPRRGPGGVVDHLWCRDQYLTGGLARRTRDTIHQLLGRIVQTATQPGAATQGGAP